MSGSGRFNFSEHVRQKFAIGIPPWSRNLSEKIYFSTPMHRATKTPREKTLWL
jgi:hypothetical protein